MKNNVCYILRVAFTILLAHGLLHRSSYSSAFCVGASVPTTKQSHRAHALEIDLGAGALSKIPRNFPKVRSLYERVTFSWAKDLMVNGNAKPLELQDIWLLPEDRRMRNSSEVFDTLLAREQRSRAGIQRKTGSEGGLLSAYWKSPVARAIIEMYKAELISTGLLKLVNTLVQFAPSLIVARILKFIGQGGKATQCSAVSANILSRLSVITSPAVQNAIAQLVSVFCHEGFQLSLLLFITLSCKTAIENQYFDAVSRLSSEVRGTLSTAVYRKALKLSPASRANNTMGEVVNYMQLDTARLEHVVHSIHTTWDGALQILGYTILLVQFLGPSVFAGIAAMFVILPLNSYFLRRISTLREANLKFTDKRVKLTNELLQGIRAIKSYNWEAPFVAQLGAIRDEELRGLKSAANMRSLLVSALSTAPSIVAVCTLATYALLGNELGPTKVFTSLALFNQLRFPLIFYPMLLNTLAEGKVSLKRLSRFLEAAEVQNYVRTSEEPCDDETVARRRTREAVRIENGTFTWGTACLPLAEAGPPQIAHPMSTEEVGAVNSTVAENRDRLSGVNLNIRRGQLVAVIGPTGSGKTTLLSALLGELDKCAGDVTVKGAVAYVPQSAWIPNDSLQNVVLFGRAMDRPRYNRVMQMCGLERDLELLEAGDQTEIGERGVNLSGGQKQRVSVARAVYEDADVYLFDDPLSALDNAVGARLFTDCIRRGLAGKTRILVTHQLGGLSQVDRIVLMDQGGEGGACRICDQGTLRELLRRGHDLTKYVTQPREEPEKPVEITPTPSAPSELNALPAVTPPCEGLLAMNGTEVRSGVELLAGSVPPSGGLVDLSSPAVMPVAIVEHHVDESPPEGAALSVPQACAEEIGVPKEVIPNTSVCEVAPVPHVEHLASAITACDESTSGGAACVKRPTQLITKEERAEGAVATKVYSEYIAAANKPLLLALLALSVIMSNVSLVWQQWVVVAWTGDAGYVKRPLAVYLSGVTAMAVLVGLFNYLRTYFGVLFGVASSRTIHREMIHRVLHAPLSFFESTPVGRLVQRFSKDLDQIDQQLPSSIGQLLSSTFSIISCMAAIAMVTPSFTLIMAGLFAAYFRVTNYYRNVARELKRVEALSRSPIYTHFSETLGGLPVIRSYKRQAIYLRNNEVRLDDNVSAYQTLKVIDRWLCVRLEVLGNAIVLFASLLATLTGSKAGSAGLSLNNALGVTSLLNWAVRNAAETEALMNSVERVSYTIHQTPQERPTIVQDIDAASVNLAALPDTVPLRATMEADSAKGSAQTLSDGTLLESGWPFVGQMTLVNVHMRYRSDFEEVLRGVDLSIRAGERVGIVGRTGSGKSSLFRALLRLTELEDGRIEIDGVDVAKMGLDALRSSVSVIPQDPVLFSGSVRFNLDPFNVHSDSQLWAALRKANLDRTVMSLPGALRYEVSEGGDNFSLGQRQLLCLARALVRRSRILLLDEATSSVDFATDALIQQTIRREFGDGSTTVLTIAHRLDSVMDADRIVVMDAGRVAECGSPAELLGNPRSLFSELVAAEQGGVGAGGETADEERNEGDLD